MQETTQTVIQIIQVTERKFGWENRNILKGVRTIALPLGLGLGLGLRFRAAIVLEPFWKQKSALEMLYNNNNEKNLSKDFIIEVFSYFIRTCHIWSLEISYYNMALALIIRETKQFRKWETLDLLFMLLQCIAEFFRLHFSIHTLPKPFIPSVQSCFNFWLKLWESNTTCVQAMII